MVAAGQVFLIVSSWVYQVKISPRAMIGKFAFCREVVVLSSVVHHNPASATEQLFLEKCLEWLRSPGQCLIMAARIIERVQLQKDRFRDGKHQFCYATKYHRQIIVNVADSGRSTHILLRSTHSNNRCCWKLYTSVIASVFSINERY